VETDNVQKYNIKLLRIITMTLIGSLGALLPFVNVYMVRQGLNGTQVGIAVTVASLVVLYFAPYWTGIHSTHRQPLVVLSLTLAGAGVAAIIFGYQTTFIGITLFNALRSAFYAAHFSISDVLVLSAIKGTDVGYGSIRLYGSVGWALIVLFTGWLTQRTNIRAGFYVYFAFNIISIVLISLLREKERFALKAESHTKVNYRKEIIHLFSDPIIRSLSYMLLIIGIGNAGVLNFETIYLDRLGATEFLIGIYSMASASVEVLAMPLTDYALRKFDLTKVLILGLFTFFLLRLSVILFPAVHTIIITRFLTGFAYSIVTVGQVVWINRSYPASLSGAVLVILTITLPTLISLVFSPLTGIVYDNFGPAWLYIIAAVFYLLGMIVLMRSNRSQMTVSQRGG
jgi:PPP family 3-phenylpropionic acid transporter